MQILLDSVNGSIIFTALDLFSGYWNSEIEECDRHKTAFIVPGSPGGIYQFNRMPFGICNGPGFFSRLVDQLFSDIRLTFVLPFIDDFTIHSRSFTDHLTHLEQVLSRIKAARLKLKPSKCVFGTHKTLFLGHELSAEGIGPNIKKVEVIKHFSCPRDLKSLRSFLGITGYYRRFIQDYATLAEPLHRLNKKCPGCGEISTSLLLTSWREGWLLSRS